jgi:hypothetical protein
MIYALNYTCARDFDLRDLMVSTFKKHSGSEHIISKDTAELKDYGNGAGWNPSMMKLNLLRVAVNKFNPSDTDFMLSVDSDVVFTSPEVFEYVDPKYGIIGIKHRPAFETLRGLWSHMSGALIFIRADIVRRMISLPENELFNIRFNHFKSFNITENEDVVLSYLASYCGSSYFDLTTIPGLTSGDFESDVAQHNRELLHELWFAGENDTNYKIPMKSFYHLNYCPTQFLGEPVTGKWDIPKVLKQKGIEL